MHSPLPRLLLALVLACSIGLHWAVLQSIAWAHMVVDYSSEGNLKQALVKTFDGKHPCALCKQIARGKQSESKTEFSLDLKKFEFSHSTTAFIFRAPSFFWEVHPSERQAKNLNHTPLLPPPRQLQG